jgi:hypothetical protein
MGLDRLGKGPFVVDAVIGPDDDGWALQGLTIEETEGCACCGSRRLVWRVAVTDQDSGRTYLVGRTCAKRAEDVDLARLEELSRAAERNRLRELRLGTSDTALRFRAWAMEQPHPKGWDGRSLLDDLNYWAGRGERTAVGKWNRAFKCFVKGDASELTKAEQQRAARKRAKRVASAAREWEWLSKRAQSAATEHRDALADMIPEDKLQAIYDASLAEELKSARARLDYEYGKDIATEVAGEA